jgi:ATP-dependent exoDNAse (exonuclease V) beta subunit
MGDYGVVWWDPRCLQLDAEPRFGIRRQELIGKEVDPQTVQADLAAYRAWRAARTRVLEAGSRQSLRVQRVTEHAEEGEEMGVEVRVVEVEREASRPAGKRFGTLVHGILATIPLRASTAAVRQAAQMHARLLGSPAEEIAAAVTAVERTLAHPLLKRARRAAAAGLCRRETPVSLRTGDGSTIVDGVVDLAFCENDTWTVIDFKTDRDLSKMLPVYRRQAHLYAQAIARATGRAVSAVILLWA